MDDVCTFLIQRLADSYNLIWGIVTVVLNSIMFHPPYPGFDFKALVSLQRFAADIISVLAMTMSGERECLKYRLVGSQEELASWGHEYVR